MIVNFSGKFGTKLRFSSSIGIDGEKFPPENLRSLGHSISPLILDSSEFAEDGAVRRALLSVAGEKTLSTWIANEYRFSQGNAPLDVRDYRGSYYDERNDAFFSFFQYPMAPSFGMSHLPFHKVLTGTFIPPDFFKDKIVIIGPEYFSLPYNYVKTPFDSVQNRSSLWVHASIVLALIQEQTIFVVPFWVTSFLSVILSLGLAVFISRLRPSTGVLLTIALVATLLLVSFLLLAFFQIWLKVALILFSLIIVYYIWVPFRAIREYQGRFAIEKEAKILKRVESLKQNFISLMSHDLKTPVAKIAGSAEVLALKVRGTKSLYDQAQNIIQATRELNSFINSILDLTKIESSRLELQKSSRDVNEIIEAVIAKRQYEAESKGVQIEVGLTPLFPIQLDAGLMQRVISNLVENAIKYTGPGGRVFLETTDDQNWVTIKVSDNGPGMDEKEQTHIFDKFYRIKNDQTHRVKGSGLGLYLVKYFVELHEGTISVNSRPGEGATFTIRLPNK